MLVIEIALRWTEFSRIKAFWEITNSLRRNRVRPKWALRPAEEWKAVGGAGGTPEEDFSGWSLRARKRGLKRRSSSRNLMKMKNPPLFRSLRQKGNRSEKETHPFISPPPPRYEPELETTQRESKGMEGSAIIFPDSSPLLQVKTLGRIKRDRDGKIKGRERILKKTPSRREKTRRAGWFH